MKCNYLFMNLFNVKLFTPGLYILLNYYLCKSRRAAMNSIFFLGTAFSMYSLNFLVNKLMNYYFDDIIEPIERLTKYKPLVFFLLF